MSIVLHIKVSLSGKELSVSCSLIMRKERARRQGFKTADEQGSRLFSD